MKVLSLISKAFEERRYSHSYVKMMHESLNDCSKRTRTDAIYHTPLVIEQWKSQKNQKVEGDEYEQYHKGQECHHQLIVHIQGDQISPSTSQKCDYFSRYAYIAWPLITKSLSTTIKTTTTSKWTTSSKITVETTTSVTSKDHNRLLNRWCKWHNSSRNTRTSGENDSLNENNIFSQYLTPHLGS